MMLSRTYRTRNAFTLIELLVVIAIISLLVSILLPSLQKAKLLTRRVLCQTRLKNIGAVYYLYMNDFNDRGPVGYSTGHAFDGWSDFLGGENPYPMYWGWYMHREMNTITGNVEWALGEYLGTGSPVETKIPILCPNIVDYAIEHGVNAGTSYAVNARLGWNVYMGDHVQVPASTPMLMDGTYPNLSTPSYIEFPYLGLPNGLGWFAGDIIFLDQATTSHEGTGNFLFFDGHTENQEELEDVDAYRYDIGWTWYGNNQQR